MERINMYEWLEAIKKIDNKAMPILSFPGIQLLDISVKDLIYSSDNQAKLMETVANRVPSIASVSMMDLSVEAECFGANMVVSENEVPTIKGALISDVDEAEALEIPKVGSKRTGIYIEAIQKASKIIKDRPILAGVIGPFSLAGRLCDVTETLIYCYTDPDLLEIVLNKVTTFLIDYIKAYKEAGANGIVIAEPLAGLLSPELASEFSESYVKKIVDEVQSEDFIVVYHNCGNSVLKQMDGILSIGAKAYHFGNAISMEKVLELVPNDTIVMGNIDPASQFKNGTIESITAETIELLSKCGKYNNFIISSGCDIPPLAKWDNIDAFFRAIDSYYNK